MANYPLWPKLMTLDEAKHKANLPLTKQCIESALDHLRNAKPTPIDMPTYGEWRAFWDAVEKMGANA